MFIVSLFFISAECIDNPLFMLSRFTNSRDLEENNQYHLKITKYTFLLAKWKQKIFLYNKNKEKKNTV